METIEQIVTDGTVLAGTLDLSQTGVDLASFADQLGKMLEPGEDTDIARRVDHGLDAVGAALLEVLRDPAVLVVEVHLHLRAGPEDPGLERHLGGTSTTVTTEHGVDDFGSSDPDVVAHHCFDEPAGPPRVVKHQGARHLHLPHRPLPAVAAGPAGGGQRGGDDRHPPVEERVDVRGTQGVTDGLQPGRVLTAGEPVGQRGVADPGLVGLPLGPLMTIEPTPWPGRASRCRS